MRPVFVFGAFAIFFGVSARIQLERCPLPLSGAAGIYGCLLLLLGLWLIPAFPDIREKAHASLRGYGGVAAALALFTAPYLVYAAGTGGLYPHALARLLAIAAGPFFIFTVFPVRSTRKLAWQDAVALAWLAIPVLARWLGGLWTVPINLDFMARLYVVAVGAWAYLVFRGVEGAGYEARISLPTLRAALVNLALITLIVVPLGFAIEFIGWNPNWRGTWQFVFSAVTLFVFIAVPEELFFRGLLQNLLEGSWGSRYGAQAAASVAFGFTHILHGFPNWSYVLLATIAGWFYGSAWRSERSLVASALTHALVDALWRTWFDIR
jgi:membrane protease YdiL (CAAX protease family)